MPRQCFNDVLAMGKPLAGGKLFTCIAGLACPGNPLASFTDSTGATLNQNPVILDAAGCASIWLTPATAYKIVAWNSVNVQEWSTDSVGGLLTFQGTAQQSTTIGFSATPTFTTIGQSQLFKMTLTANVTSSTLVMTGISAPSLVTFEITQDSTGGRTFVWPLNVIGGATIASAANAVTTQQFVWDGVNVQALGVAVTGPGPTVSPISTPSVQLGSSQVVTGFQGSAGTKAATATGTWTNGHLLQANGNGDLADVGVTNLNAVAGALPVMIFKSGVSITHTGDLTEDTVYSVPLPALNANSVVRIWLIYRQTVQDANLTLYKVRLGGTRIDALGVEGGNTNQYAVRLTIQNKNVTNSQFTVTEELGLTAGTSVGNGTTTVDTSVPQTLTVTAQNQVTTTNAQRFDQITVEVIE